MKKLLVGLIALFTIAAGAISPASAVGGKTYTVVEEALPFDALDGATPFWGVQGGAGYRYEVPEHWNGDLVMWAHGYAGTGTDLFVQNPPPGLRAYLIENGYAWGASSYSSNDYVVATPAKETRRLTQSFKEITGAGRQPAHRYLLGVSMGGNITTYSGERYRSFYDGLLPACGVQAPTDLFDYFLDTNLAFQSFGGTKRYPITLADAEEYLTVDVQDNKAALEAAPGTWPAVLNPNGEALKDLVEVESGGDRPNFDEAWLFWNGPAGDFLWQNGIDTGTVPIEGQFNGNADKIYQIDGDPAINDVEAALNADITRVERDRYLPYQRKEVPAASGRFVDPMLTMHTLGDLFVPFSMQTAYAEKVQDRGFPNKLVQRAIRGVQHCGFTTPEWITAFQDLENWVENGVKPDGDVVSDPAAVADPNYGCRFTQDTPGAPDAHVLAAPCDGD
jgi:hypothetical protein